MRSVDEPRDTLRVTDLDPGGGRVEGAGRQRRRLTATVTDLGVVRQRAFLLGVQVQGMDAADAERSLVELGLLTDTAGSDPVGNELVRRAEIDAATFIGSGKASEIAAVTAALDVDVVVVDNELTPAQQRNLQRIFGCDVVDREALILDIFAQHATSRAGSLQVELALLRYHLPRLRGRGVEMSRLGGGIGTRGPGETKLETDRRRILARISRLERELADLARIRATQAKARTRARLARVALVGYTNAGKSTLLNALADAAVLTENRLFSTLDPTVRRTELPSGRVVLLSDTVGFVRRLPHRLIEAFRSTLDDVRDADLLVHVVDASDPDPAGQIAAVREVLADIDAAPVPELVVFNKADVASPTALARLRNLHPGAVVVSAATGDGLDSLLRHIDEETGAARDLLRIEVPWSRGDVIAAAHRLGTILAEEASDESAVLSVLLPETERGRFEDFVVA